MSKRASIFQHCLYFSANALARVITRMAEEEFNLAGLSPSYAFLMMLVYDEPGIIQKDLADRLQLAPSTVTRFIDKLERRGFLERRAEGKTSRVYATEKGCQLQDTIDAAWHALYERYSQVLGKEHSEQLATLIDKANQKLEP